jgi:hypothetical protein
MKDEVKTKADAAAVFCSSFILPPSAFLESAFSLS